MRFEAALLCTVLLIGCGKKSESTETSKPASPKQSVSIETSPESAPPPPVAEKADSAPPPPDNVAPVLTPQQAEQQFKDGEKQERAYEERLKRNGKWLQAMQKASPAEQQRILAEIRAAKLTPAEIQELEAIKQYFGVTVSFR